ncbi:MAG TPA: hypothetical protein VNK67_11335 [Burkholderiales bacterium]|nr:hypothetical protein [Burkholderiales bacterium]
MAGTLRFYTSEWLTCGLHFIILSIAVQAETAAVWPYALAAISAVSFFAWIAAYRRYRLVHDLPTSKVATAAQGYVELFGRSEQIEGTPVLSRLTGLPCCWFRYTVERRGSHDGKWVPEDSGESNAHFLLVDDTGECVVSPEGAEVITRRKQTWREGDRRYTEWLLLPKGRLYALGEFVTVSAQPLSAAEERAEVGALIAEWKRDPRSLEQRFDLNRDGTLDMKEWELARLQARREVRGRRAQALARSVEGVHLLRKPRDGRLFLLADELPERIGRRYALWSAVHLFIFIGAGTLALLL